MTVSVSIGTPSARLRSHTMRPSAVCGWRAGVNPKRWRSRVRRERSVEVSKRGAANLRLAIRKFHLCRRRRCGVYRMFRASLIRASWVTSRASAGRSWRAVVLFLELLMLGTGHEIAPARDELDGERVDPPLPPTMQCHPRNAAKVGAHLFIRQVTGPLAHDAQSVRLVHDIARSLMVCVAGECGSDRTSKVRAC